MLVLHLALSIAAAAYFGLLHGVGILLAFIALHLVLRLLPIARNRRHAQWVERGCMFSFWFIGQVLLASVQVARLVLARRVQVEPAIVALRLQTRDERMVTLIGGLLTLTPGTLALDYRAEDDTLFIHALDARHEDEVTGMIRELERRLLHWLRPAPEASNHDR